MSCKHPMSGLLRMEMGMKTLKFQFFRQHGVEATIGDFPSMLGEREGL